jgi:DNA-binding transcriptional regulator LsrR (DeoR family)
LELSADQIREYTKAAYFYYKANFSQEEIAQKMGMSRQRVNRILNDCVKQKIVRITIDPLENNNGELEAALEEKYSMNRVCVAESFLAKNLTNDLGEKAAKLLESIIKDGDTIGISRGRSTLALAENLPFMNTRGITATQLIGSENRAGSQIAVDGIVYRLAEKLRAQPVMLYAPVVVHDESLLAAITKEPFFTDAYKVITSCGIAVVGIEHDTGRLLEYLRPLSSTKDKTDAERELQNVAGETCTHFFDREGNAVIPSFRKHIVAVLLDDYKKIPVRLGIAGGAQKAAAIAAAMKGGYITHLVTDAETAKSL